MNMRSISGESLAMANDINREAYRLSGNRNLMDRYLSDQANFRNLSMQSSLIVLVRFSPITFCLCNHIYHLENAWLDQARTGEVVILRADETNKLRAVVKLNSFVDAYLLVSRFIDIQVLEAMDSTDWRL